VRKLELISHGGTKIAARVFDPPCEPHGNVVIGGAMGVRQDYYQPFAEWLAEQGWRVTTFDYRGAGDSAPQSLRGFRANLDDWTRDYEAAIDHAHAALPDAPLYLLGHSLGAQLPGLLRNQQKVSGLLSVAAGSGYWRDNAPQLKRGILYFWFLLVPLATRLCGYFPGRKLKKVGDVPAGVMLQWRRWCLDPHYSFGAEGAEAQRSYAAARFPVLALSVTDDEMMTWRGTQTLIGFYANAPRRIERVAPQDVGVRRLGHFGAFRREQAATVWPRLQEWLQSLGKTVAA
jgi:predicted alpha/beta hydrolase